MKTFVKIRRMEIIIVLKKRCSTLLSKHNTESISITNDTYKFRLLTKQFAAF